MPQQQSNHRPWRRWMGLGLTLSLGWLSVTGRIAQGAERLTTYLGPIQLDLAVNALEQFATTGEITPDLAPYASRFAPDTLSQLQQGLNLQIEEGPSVVAQFAYSAMGEDLLQRLGTIIQTNSGLNGFHAVRAGLILAAADETAGLTPLNFLRTFPTSEIRLNSSALLKFVDTVAQYQAQTNEAIAHLIQQSEAEATANPLMTPLPDLRPVGSFAVVRQELTIPVEEFPSGEFAAVTASQTLSVDLYLPALPDSADQAEDHTQAASVIPDSLPLIVISHPLASTRRKLAYQGEYLASHGFVVAIPEHQGSNGERMNAFINGEHRNLMEAQEYPQRSYEISTLLDYLAESPDLRIDLERVGIFGSSLGGTTALGMAGASLNPAQLHQLCAPNYLTVNLSILLQCRAQELPVESRHLADPRIRAVVALFPPTSAIFGEEGMAEIDVPTMLISGSQDQLALPLSEQLQPFTALETPDKYLVLLDPGNHYTLDAVGSEERVPDFLEGDRPDPAIGRGYVQVLTLAFFQHYLNGDSGAKPYLSAAYTQQISQEELQVYLVRSLLLPE